MRCLSLKQPFADLIVSGRKTIELRTWNTNFRGQFLVHASGGTYKEECALNGLEEKLLDHKSIIGMATLYGVKRYLTSAALLADKDKTGIHRIPSPKRIMYGFLLKDATRFEVPIPFPGRLGFFEANVRDGMQYSLAGRKAI